MEQSPRKCSPTTYESFGMEWFLDRSWRCKHWKKICRRCGTADTDSCLAFGGVSGTPGTTYAKTESMEWI